MSNCMRLERKFHVRGKRGRINGGGDGTKHVSQNRIPRVSRLIALAIKFDQLITSGMVCDQAELARLGRVSRARVTHIMNLVHLAPDIQQWLLESNFSNQGREIISERQLRPITAQANWRKQRELLSRLLPTT